MEMVLWMLGGLLLLGVAARITGSRQHVATPPVDDDDVIDTSTRWGEDDVIDTSTRCWHDDVAAPDHGHGCSPWQAIPSGASYSHGWANASAGTDTAWHDPSSAFCPAVNVDGTPMATCSIDVEGKPYGVTDTWNDNHVIGATHDIDHQVGAVDDFNDHSASTHSFDDDWVNASSSTDHSWDDRW